MYKKLDQLKAIFQSKVCVNHRRRIFLFFINFYKILLHQFKLHLQM
jgi:hypothetical protein